MAAERDLERLVVACESWSGKVHTTARERAGTRIYHQYSREDKNRCGENAIGDDSREGEDSVLIRRFCAGMLGF